MASLLRRSRALSCFVLALMSVGAGACRLRQPPLPVDRSQEARIRAEVVARIADEPSLDAESIRVDVNGAMVLLHGLVRGMGAWQCAITNAGLVSGVESVVDYLVIERGERDVRCLAPRPDSSLIVSEP